MIARDPTTPMRQPQHVHHQPSAKQAAWTSLQPPKCLTSKTLTPFSAVSTTMRVSCKRFNHIELPLAVAHSLSACSFSYRSKVSRDAYWHRLALGNC